MALTIPDYTYVTHKLINRPWGPEVRFTVKDSNNQFIDEVTPIKSMSATDSELVEVISGVLARIKAAKDHAALFSHDFDGMGEELKQAFRWLVQKIRQYPNATLTQAETAWNAEWADSLFTWDKLVVHFRNRVGGITWNKFKTFVINRKFEGD